VFTWPPLVENGNGAAARFRLLWDELTPEKLVRLRNSSAGL
jgi:hypothetical protein